MYIDQIPSVKNTQKLTKLGPPTLGQKTTEIKEREDLYTPEAVSENKNKDLSEYEDDENAESVKRHYIQPEAVSHQAVKTLLQRHNIPTSEQKWTIFAGYTGELATTLSELNNTIYFTDPIEHWVNTHNTDFAQTKQTTLQGLPSDLIAQSNGVTTFEGYGPLHNDIEMWYEIARSLTTEHGFTFFESEFTRNCTRYTGSGKTLMGELNAFTKAPTYDIQAQYRQRGDLRAYNVRATNDQTRIKILRDLYTIYALLNLYFKRPEDSQTEVRSLRVTQEVAEIISNQIETTPREIKEVIERFAKIHHDMLSDVEKTYNRSGTLNVSVRSTAVAIYPGHNFEP